MATTIIDAMGEPCPIPVVKTTKALREMTEPGVLEVLVDNETAVQNLTRLGASQGCAVQAGRTGESCRKSRTKLPRRPDRPAPPPRAESWWPPSPARPWARAATNWGPC